MKTIKIYSKLPLLLMLCLFSIFVNANEGKSSNGSGKDAKEYTLYFDNGKIQEQGYWFKGKNLGSFVRYYENGQKSQEFFFDENGKRSGLQKYYYENGQVRMTGNWKDGKEIGDIIFYNVDGSVKHIKRFDSGELTSIISERVVITDYMTSLNQ